MMLYLTGANTSLAKSVDNPQPDVNKSLGGYVSSTPVPNAAINALFDLVSSFTLERKPKETIALGLINKTDKIAKDVELKIVTDIDNVAEFKVAAVAVGSDYLMEQIANRYQEPISAEFHDVSFYRASVDIEIIRPGVKSEEIALYPFNVQVEIKESGIEGTWEAFEEAFNNDETYSVRRITENVFRIEKRDEEMLEEPIKCSYIATEGFSASFKGEFFNKGSDNTALISEELQPGECVGIWLQRIIKKGKDRVSNDDLLYRHKNGIIRENEECVELIINYNLEEKP